MAFLGSGGGGADGGIDGVSSQPLRRIVLREG
jgi:hypothetical protein